MLLPDSYPCLYQPMTKRHQERVLTVSDAYDGYEKVEGITRCLCYSHLRRYCIDAISLDSGGKKIPGSVGVIGRAYCDKLFRLERKWKALSPEEQIGRAHV